MDVYTPRLPLPVRPIDMLPVEILAAILTFSLPPIQYAQAPQRGSLALVCYRWNAVIEATPVFWSKISCEDSMAQVEKALIKSNVCPIDLHSDWPHFDIWGKGNPWRRRRFLKLVNCHIERWRHVTLDVRTKDTFPLSVTPAPLLESLNVLSVWTGAAAEAPVEIRMFDGTSTPYLREVYVDGVEIVGWKKAFPPTLSELIVKNMDRWGPSLSELFTICISCPNITILEVSNVAVDLDLGQISATAPLLEFPGLRKLTLCELGEEVTYNILQRLRFPTDCVVRLFSELLTPQPSTSLTSMFSHHLDNSNVVIDQLTIRIRARRDVIKAEGPRWNIIFELADTEAVRDAVLWFNGNGVTSRNDSPQHSRRSIPVSLELDYDILVDGFDFLSSISDLQCIAKIALNSADLAILSHITVQGFKQKWPFPGVRELHFKYPSVQVDPVIKLVQERRGERDELGAAAPLQKIKFGDEFKTISPARPDSLLMLLDVVDEGTQVSWYGKQVLRD